MFRDLKIFRKVIYVALAICVTCLTVTSSADTSQLFQTPFSNLEMAGKQAVVKTDRGQFTIDLLPEVAPNHVGHFIQSAENGVYDGTIFHQITV